MRRRTQCAGMRLVARVLRLGHVLVQVQHVAERTKRRCPVGLARLLPARLIEAGCDVDEFASVARHQRQGAKHRLARIEHREGVPARRFRRIRIQKAVARPDCPIRILVDIAIEQEQRGRGQRSIEIGIEKMVERPSDAGGHVLRRRRVLACVVVFAYGAVHEPRQQRICSGNHVERPENALFILLRGPLEGGHASRTADELEVTGSVAKRREAVEPQCPDQGRNRRSVGNAEIGKDVGSLGNRGVRGLLVRSRFADDGQDGH